jgi:hypothetical protein
MIEKNELNRILEFSKKDLAKMENKLSLYALEIDTLTLAANNKLNHKKGEEKNKKK